MTDPALASTALESYNRISRSLAALHRERGDLVSASIEARVSGYQQSIAEGDTVSTARHHADLASKGLSQEIAKLDGEIDGGNVELRYLDQLLVHYRG